MTIPGESKSCYDMRQKMERVETLLANNDKQTQMVFNAIYGNGKPGLITELQRLRDSVEAHQKSVDNSNNNRQAQIQWAITSLIAVAAIVASFLN